MQGLWIEVKVCFGNEEYEALKAHAAKHSQSVSEHIRHLLRQHLNDCP